MQRRRSARFDMRVAADPSAVRVLEGVGRYVLIHPMGDESELLQSLGLTPNDCTVVDCYLENGGDIDFVQVQSSRYAQRNEVGIRARTQADEGYRDNFVVVVLDAAIDRSVVEASLRRIVELRRTPGSYGAGCIASAEAARPRCRRRPSTADLRGRA